MTGGTICTKLSVVLIVTAMAGETILRRASEYTVLMTTFTGCADMCPCQLEGGEVVIKFGWFPGFGGMTGGAIRTETSFMCFVFLMAGVAILRCAFVNVVFMTGLTFCFYVRASQWEGEQGMIYGDLIPACGGMTSRAVLSKLTVMFVVLFVA